MSNRVKILLIIGGGTVLIVLIILGFYFSGKEQKEKFQDLTRDENAPIPYEQIKPGIPDLTINQPTVTNQDRGTGEVRSLSMAFVDSFGSYSNSGDFSDISRMQTVMTPEFLGYVQNSYLPELQKKHVIDGFPYVMRTKSLVAKIIEERKEEMKIMISTSRKEKSGNNEENIFNQDILVSLKKIDNNWFIDGAFWQ